MKSSLLTASVLLGCASAEVHKLKLNKVPLTEQFVSYLSHLLWMKLAKLDSECL
jgi:hypothetical protein